MKYKELREGMRVQRRIGQTQYKEGTVTKCGTSGFFSIHWDDSRKEETYQKDGNLMSKLSRCTEPIDVLIDAVFPL